MDSDSSRMDAELGLSHREWTAFAHGVGFAELARWRAEGWPSLGPSCGTTIVLDAFGWLARVSDDGTHRLVHIRCLSM